jgi:hypothetical protein
MLEWTGFGKMQPAKAAFMIVAASALTVMAISCGGSGAPPTMAPTPAPAPVPVPAPQVAFAGTWSGTGVDSQGATTVAWSLTQTGTTVSGTVATQAVNPDDGSCNSCHRNKSGSVSGAISGSTLTLTMFFAAGGDGDRTPACSATLTGNLTIVADRMLSGEYSGADTCEGPFANGTLAMARQP